MNPSDNDLAAELITAADQMLRDLTSRPTIAESIFDHGAAPQIWTAMHEAGCFELIHDPAYGGLGLGWEAVGAFARLVGHHLVPGPVLEHTVVAPMLHAVATAQARSLLDDVLAGTRSLGLVDAGAVGAMGLPQLRDGRVHGVVDLAWFGASADLLAVVVSDEDGYATVALLDPQQPEVRRTPTPSFDALAHQARIELRGAAATRVVDGGDCLVTRLRGAMRLTLGCVLAGLARRMLEEAVDYAKVRHQFGAPIGSFQAVQHLLAEMATDVLLLEAFCEENAAAATVTPEAIEWLGMEVKAFASRIARRVGEGALQVHGGIGFTAEHHIHHWFHHALALQGWYGDEADLGVRIGRKALADGSRL